MSVVMIAPGHNNVAGLKRLEALSAGLFTEYDDDIENVLTNWVDIEEREMDGDRNYVDIGLESVTWIFFRLSRAELAYLNANFSGDVTIRTLNQQSNAYHNYNAKMTPLRAGVKSGKWEADSIGGWSDVPVEFYDLELIN